MSSRRCVRRNWGIQVVIPFLWVGIVLAQRQGQPSSSGQTAEKQPPQLSRKDFNYLNHAVQVTKLSPEFEAWLDADRKRDDQVFGCSDGESREETEIFLLGEHGADHVYIVQKPHSCSCGAHGNCPLELVKEDSQGVNLIGRSAGWGAAIHEEDTARWPDVFFITHESTAIASIVGYANVNGRWARQYCGAIDFEKSSEAELSSCK